MNSVGTLLVALALALAGNRAEAEFRTAAGVVSTDRGHIALNGRDLTITREYDGKNVPLRNAELMTLRSNPGYFIAIYWDSKPGAEILTRHFRVVDATRTTATVSNAVDSRMEFEWTDNNFAVTEDQALYFGVFQPKRLQFSYKNGALSAYSGRWRGPREARVYNAPDQSLPCANVADVPACLDEVERNRPRKHR